MIRVGSNVLSQRVQRNLGLATHELASTSERLASGKRINNASDDAAGLSIAMSLNKDRVLARTAQRNISDGISMVSILGAGLSSQKSILMRMTELAEQAANGTYSNQQRKALQTEYSTLMDEFDRIGDTTTFNGVRLLRNPTGDTIQFMAGITGADSSLLSVTAANSHRYAGMISQKSDMDESGTITFSDYTTILTHVTEAVSPPTSTPSSSSPTSKPENPDAALVSFTDSLGRTGTLAFIITRAQADFGLRSKYSPLGPQVADTASRQEIFYYASSGGETSSNSTNLTMTSSVPSAFTLNFTFATSGATASVTFDLSGAQFQSYDSGRSSQMPSAIGFTNLSSITTSRRAVPVLQNRINEISSIEGRYGAISSRLEVANYLMATRGENFAAAASRIEDTDVAAESANAVRLSIIQQSAVSILAQANQAPGLAISLLRNV